MSRNESNLDRMIRVALAVVAVVGAVIIGASSLLGAVLFVVAGILLVTAAVGFCPLYRLLGIDTDKSASKVSTHV
jgi:hypothetical protein